MHGSTLQKGYLGLAQSAPTWEIAKNQIKEALKYMDPKSEIKIRRLHKYFPDVIFVLIDNDGMTPVVNLSGMIRGFFTPLLLEKPILHT